MKRVLVLCTGNSCRSQMAESYLRFYANELLEVESAGLRDQGVNPMTIKVMEEDNIDTEGLLSKPLSTFYGQHFDYLITVCNRAADADLAGLSYDEHIHFDIPDPALATGAPERVEREFLRVREIVKKNMLKFLGKLMAESQ
ncbi:arsenate reductase ArsC [Phaeodactylibacter luteus]|nr:arsenate reductase ArsC [Phaeodactylibacter luteus]